MLNLRIECVVINQEITGTHIIILHSQYCLTFREQDLIPDVLADSCFGETFGLARGGYRIIYGGEHSVAGDYYGDNMSLTPSKAKDDCAALKKLNEVRINDLTFIRGQIISEILLLGYEPKSLSQGIKH